MKSSVATLITCWRVLCSGCCCCCCFLCGYLLIVLYVSCYTCCLLRNERLSISSVIFGAIQRLTLLFRAHLNNLKVTNIYNTTSICSHFTDVILPAFAVIQKPLKSNISLVSACVVHRFRQGVLYLLMYVPPVCELQVTYYWTH